jgi:hypothetical protein
MQMTSRAEGTFLITGWDENTYEELEDGAKLTKAHVLEDLAGDLQGTGTWESLMCYRDDGTADYTGFQRVVGRIGDRSGSFVLQTNGTYDGTDAKTDWVVVAGSGTDDLRGLTGEGSAVAGHGMSGTFTLDYEVD